ncbi:Fe-S cluster biogenesis protein NfuA, 4Fe-4S-binding domain [Marivirga sericea]|uniref:Fe-S cluster biogenesis protein NfuA, 4Fe-4S-binding domain n=1 Tax=Marivirga sericea TaxID=1028 RepID=A0A1X7LJ70_9BACT|nr:NifU family protein [Marivirga sericea]SMG53229.1 Fe-S cluster biogenesis protein NfuA, 4Fe-4S-binding domain [Marivirga sericea]
MSTQTQQPVTIYMEANPNPNSLKFATNQMLVPEGDSFDFPSIKETARAPLAEILFHKEYVDRVFYMSNFVTVTKKPEYEWVEIQNDVKDTIKEFLESGKRVIELQAKDLFEETNTSENAELEEQIKNILEEYIKPAVEQDGGAISFHSYDKDAQKVKVLLQGSCSGCPSSTITLKAGIENLLKRMLPNDVQEVEAEGV